MLAKDSGSRAGSDGVSAQGGSGSGADRGSGGSQSGDQGRGGRDRRSASERQAARLRLAARLGAESGPAASTALAAPATAAPAGRPGTASPDASSAPAADDAPASADAGPAPAAAPPAAAPPGAPTDDSSERSPDRSSSGGAQDRSDEGGTRERRTSLLLISGIPIELLLALVAVVLTALGLAIGLLRERGRYRDAEREALTDPLTGLANRIAFEHQLAIDWQRAARYGRPLGMLLLDLDGFKQVNDTQGHAAGDRVLCRVADAIAGSVRGGDVAARLGGDEFVVLATETPAEGLRVLAGRLRSAVEDLGAGVSVGWAERRPDDDSPSEVLERADQAMYEDKATRANGRPARIPA